jgi:hypothetical protein
MQNNIEKEIAKILQDFHWDCHKPNPEGKTELIDYDGTARRIINAVELSLKKQIREEIEKEKQKHSEWCFTKRPVVGSCNCNATFFNAVLNKILRSLPSLQVEEDKKEV